MKSHLLSSAAAAFAVVLLASSARAADDSASTIKFSDPSKPGTVKITHGRGDLRIQGADTNEVTVKTESKAITSKPRKDGLRVISASSSYALKESDNVVTIDSATEWGKGSGDFRLTVPRNTRVIVQNSWGGDITCSNISGDIEINCMHGEIKLDDVAGGVVVSTMNGEIRASIRELQEGKPVSFTSMNGEVQLRVPESAKANVRLRTQNGSVLTDFDETALVTKTETTAGMSRARSGVIWKGPGGGKVMSAEIEEAIREATRVSATAVREALEAVKSGLEASRMDSEEARHKLEEARKEIEQARRETEQARREVERERRTVVSARSGARPPAEAVPAVPPVAPVPGKPAAPAPVPAPGKVPTISGGKLVTGTLNGGGPEISVSTMNGDVILRKLDLKK